MSAFSARDVSDGIFHHGQGCVVGWVALTGWRLLFLAGWPIAFFGDLDDQVDPRENHAEGNPQCDIEKQPEGVREMNTIDDEGRPLVDGVQQPK